MYLFLHYGLSVKMCNKAAYDLLSCNKYILRVFLLHLLTLILCVKNCSAVIDFMKEAGQIKREQRDLEEQVCKYSYVMYVHTVLPTLFRLIERAARK